MFNTKSTTNSNTRRRATPVRVALGAAGLTAVILGASGHGPSASAGPMGNTKWGDIELGTAAGDGGAQAWIAKIELAGLKAGSSEVLMET
jgi:hypothetical protein